MKNSNKNTKIILLRIHINIIRNEYKNFLNSNVNDKSIQNVMLHIDIFIKMDIENS